jgi:hypothetical protein
MSKAQLVIAAVVVEGRSKSEVGRDYAYQARSRWRRSVSRLTGGNSLENRLEV